MAYIDFSGVYERGFQVNVYGLENPANKYEQFGLFVAVQNSTIHSDYWTSSNSGRSTNRSVSGMSPNTNYRVTVQAKWSGTWYDVDTAYVYTPGEITEYPPDPPSYIRLDSATKTTLSLSWNDVPTAMEYFVMANGEGHSNVTSPYTTLEGLRPDTDYYVCIRSHNVAGASEPTCRTFRTLGEIDRPPDWSWSYNMYPGRYFYKYVGNNACVVPASEWNNFCDRVNAFRRYKKLPAKSFRRVSSGDTFRTSDIKAVSEGISDMDGGRVYYTTHVESDWFNSHRDRLNAIR